MEALIIDETPATPKISLFPDTGKFEITGNSLPEDVMTYFAPVINWIKEYVQKPAPQTTVEIKLVYFNSSSSKAILDILGALNSIFKNGGNIEVNWYYMEIDEDMLSTGQEFESMLNIPFNFYVYVQ